MNIELTILQKDIEDFLNVAVFSLLVEEFKLRPSPVRLPRSLNVAADLAELPESLMARIHQQEVRGWVTRSASPITNPPCLMPRSRGLSDTMRRVRGLLHDDARRASETVGALLAHGLRSSSNSFSMSVRRDDTGQLELRSVGRRLALA
jgi:hypothetical protein